MLGVSSRNRKYLFLILFLSIILSFQNCGDGARGLSTAEESSHPSSSPSIPIPGGHLGGGDFYDGRPEYRRSGISCSNSSSSTGYEYLEKLELNDEGQYVYTDICRGISRTIEPHLVTKLTAGSEYMMIGQHPFKNIATEFTKIPEVLKTALYCQANVDQEKITFVIEQTKYREDIFASLFVSNNSLDPETATSLKEFPVIGGKIAGQRVYTTTGFRLTVDAEVTTGVALGFAQASYMGKDYSTPVDCFIDGDEEAVVASSRLLANWQAPRSLGMLNDGAIIKDYSDASNHGEVRYALNSLAGSISVRSAPGQPDQRSLSFYPNRGSEIYVGDPNDGSLDFGTSSFSISTWVFVEERSSPLSRETIISKGNGADSPGFALNVGSSSWQLNISDGNSNQFISLGYANDFYNRWVYLTFTIDRENQILKGYVDGEAVEPTKIAANTFSGEISNSDPLLIGNSLDRAYPFRGYLGELYLSEGALTDSEVKNFYNAKRLYYKRSLLLHLGGWWSFENAPATILQKYDKVQDLAFFNNLLVSETSEAGLPIGERGAIFDGTGNTKLKLENQWEYYHAQIGKNSFTASILLKTNRAIYLYDSPFEKVDELGFYVGTGSWSTRLKGQSAQYGLQFGTNEELRNQWQLLTVVINRNTPGRHQIRTYTGSKLIDIKDIPDDENFSQSSGYNVYRLGYSNPFDGEIAQIYLWQQALTPEQIGYLVPTP